MKRGIWISCILSALGLLFFFLNPSNSALFPKCPFLLVTGWKCPGCGSQRAIHHLLHLNVSEAFHNNALLTVFVIPLCLLMIIEYHSSFSKIRSKINHPIVILMLFFIICTWWILRNILNW